MTIYRIGELHAKENKVDDLREFMISIMPLIKGSKGCISSQFYQSQDDPSIFMMIEVWESSEAHQASVKTIPPEKLIEIKPLLGSPPTGGYFKLIAE
jgi:heme oxygenase (mycobilin-producing)